MKPPFDIRHCCSAYCVETISGCAVYSWVGCNMFCWSLDSFCASNLVAGSTNILDTNLLRGPRLMDEYSLWVNTL